MTQVLETERLLIRKFHPDEVELFLDLYADEAVTEFLVKRSREENQKRFTEDIEKYKDGSGLGRWAIFNRLDNDFIGVCGIRTEDGNAKCAELGYVLHQKYWGKGIAGEMAWAMVHYAFGMDEITEVIAVTMPLNIASQRVLEKTGFVRGENILRDGREVAFFRVLKGA